MTAAYSGFAADMVKGGSRIPAVLPQNVSAGRTQGTYSNAVIFQAVATGTSVTCGGT